MVLSIINEELNHYKKLLIKADYGELYKWEALKTFQETWDIDATDFKLMYDKSLQSKVSNNLWANPHWFPKAVMLHFIEHDKEQVRQMFRDLFDEEEGIDKRIEQFVYHCDQLLKETIVDGRLMQHHFHDGQRIVSLYLAFRYPDRYAIYKYTEFKTFMEIVRAKDVPSTGEYERFFKVVRTLYGILTKDQELMKLYRAVLNDDCYQDETLMLAQDFIFVTSRRFLGK